MSPQKERHATLAHNSFYLVAVDHMSGASQPAKKNPEKKLGHMSLRRRSAGPPAAPAAGLASGGACGGLFPALAKTCEKPTTRQPWPSRPES